MKMMNRILRFVIAISTLVVGVSFESFIERHQAVNSSYKNLHTFHVSNSSRFVRIVPRRSCLKTLDIGLGDSFTSVSIKLNLTPHYMGLNENGSWRVGKNTDFRDWTSPGIQLTSEDWMHRWVDVEFDDHQRLVSLKVSWSLGYVNDPKVRKLVIDEVFGKRVICQRPNGLTSTRVDFLRKIVSDDYFEELRASKSSSIWSVNYLIQHKNSTRYFE